jgi:DNA repair protein RadD
LLNNEVVNTKQRSGSMTVHQARDYQIELEQGIYAAWRGGARNVLAVLPTGGGKSFVVARIAAAFNSAVAVIAHRSELVTQMSTALAREGVRHRVIGPAALSRTCTSLHMDEMRRSFIEPSSRVAVCSVNTLVGMNPADPWLRQVGMWAQDEAHHITAGSVWGKAAEMLPNALGLGVTATPTRLDRKGLGRHADGLMDAMVLGPTPRVLINRGFLADYRIFAPLSDLDLSSVPTTDSGEYSPEKLKAARRKSTITGDVVASYLRFANGKLGITFDTDIESATETAAAYRAAGVVAEVITGKTPDLLRASLMRDFRARKIQQLVSVDILGEGVDVPAVEVVSMARPTQSYGLFAQQFGRALRVSPGKDRAIIIDHVGNVLRHGLPDAPREWTLDRGERRSKTKNDGVIPLRSCVNPECVQVYERALVACPYCGTIPPVADRSSPDRVDGDLAELDPAVLAKLRGEIERIEALPVIPLGMPPEGWNRYRFAHESRAAAQTELKREILSLIHISEPTSPCH